MFFDPSSSSIPQHARIEVNFDDGKPGAPPYSRTEACTRALAQRSGYRMNIVGWDSAQSARWNLAHNPDARADRNAYLTRIEADGGGATTGS